MIMTTIMITGHTHDHEHAHAHPHDHSHGHDHPAHSHDADMSAGRAISIEEDILARNDAVAAKNPRALRQTRCARAQPRLEPGIGKDRTPLRNAQGALRCAHHGD